MKIKMPIRQKNTKAKIQENAAFGRKKRRRDSKETLKHQNHPNWEKKSFGLETRGTSRLTCMCVL